MRSKASSNFPSLAAQTVISAFLACLVFAGCSLISPYDPTSYKNATDLKAEALLLIEKAKDPPTAYKTAIDSLRLKLRQAYEYEAGKGKANTVSKEQWKILVDPNRNLLGGFLKRWEEENKGFKEDYLRDQADVISLAFDQIIELENYKVKN